MNRTLLFEPILNLWINFMRYFEVLLVKIVFWLFVVLILWKRDCSLLMIPPFFRFLFCINENGQIRKVSFHY